MTTITHHRLAAHVTPAVLSARKLGRLLAAAGLGTEYTHRPAGCELTITGVVAGRSSLTLTTAGYACWHYEPATGPVTGATTLTSIIGFLLAVPEAAAQASDPAAYQAFPLKGKVGRILHDQGLAVKLQVSEDWESYEATTTIDVTSPARPWLGTVTLADNADLDWRCNWRTAFRDNPAALIDVITPILRHR
jgi:hypothetical protein